MKTNPSYFRLTILIEASEENGKVMSEIAAFAESKMPVIAGGKLIKTAQEFVHAIETYGSSFPPMPGAVRKSPPNP